MTQNATAYFQVEEGKRSNRAHEAETYRHNVQLEQAERNKVDEMIRHNQQAEILERERNYELARHNQQQEQLAALGYKVQRELGLANVQLGYANVEQAYANLSEMIRSHRASEYEVQRSHRAQEKEAIRHNYATEFNTAFANKTQLMQAGWNYNVGKQQANTAQYNSRTQRRSVNNEFQLRSQQNKLTEQRNTNEFILGAARLGNDAVRNATKAVTDFIDAIVPF